jgi:phosphoribosylaminoimidazolecarboxamide formyltransferase/IMP cyclohydrolase
LLDFVSLLNNTMHREGASMITIKRAVLSVSDKTGIVDFAKVLVQHNVEILSTGGTASTLRAAGIPVKDIAEYTGFPEILDGRVKTLHPRIYGGILYRRENPDHVRQIEEHEIGGIDMVVVNLYPFASVVKREGATEEEIIENIDIGGPSMVRASAKNWENVVVAISPESYGEIIEEIESNGGVSKTTSYRLAGKVFQATSYYDWLIGRYFERKSKDLFPARLALYLEKNDTLRYGENHHQSAAWYKIAEEEADFHQYQGKELSYNNFFDMESAIVIAESFKEPACAIVKHSNPCGVAIGDTCLAAFLSALMTDPLSPFGGIIGCNREVDALLAEKIIESFYEVVIAPSFSPEALDIFRKKENLRIIKKLSAARPLVQMKSVGNGMLLQTPDTSLSHTLTVVTKKEPTAEEMKALLFSWTVCAYVKSNAIVLGTSNRTLGIGAGQMSRYDAARVAVMKMNDQSASSVTPLVMASDAFFPFPDSVEVAADAGVTAVIHPGGSQNDKKVIKVCDTLGISMVITEIRHFRH